KAMDERRHSTGTLDQRPVGSEVLHIAKQQFRTLPPQVSPRCTNLFTQEHEITALTFRRASTKRFVPPAQQVLKSGGRLEREDIQDPQVVPQGDAITNGTGCRS